MYDATVASGVPPRISATNEGKLRGNQIAIHFLATCKALHFEGTKYLWESNTFTFTSVETVRNLAELRTDIRSQHRELQLRLYGMVDEEGYEDKVRSAASYVREGFSLI
ncbi:hypothetical protein B0I35DRAFT_479133 [Stachybotrys elegans]|uniref:Uncharacterized protein n=1 Tax=Stachybotrys elegans TaxID=80388 RepID=A0A8K0SVM8_9HYPO|nr:hypothetical protein B0I35DRAFT_479133 [Stachybotrys elegans]